MISDMKYVEQLLAEMDKRYQQRFDAQEAAISMALAQAEKTVSKAELSAEKRFDLLNELRSGVATRVELESLEKLVTQNSDRLLQNESIAKGANNVASRLVTIISLLAVVTGVIIALVHLHI